MLIRTQNKDRVVCLENCNGIALQKMERIIPSVYKVCADFYGGSRVELGIYESEKRAKEILEEIIEFYTALKVIEFGGCVSFEERQKFGDMKIGCYDMPAE